MKLPIVNEAESRETRVAAVNTNLAAAPGPSFFEPGLSTIQSLTYYLHLIRRYKLRIGAFVVVMMAAMALFTLTRQKLYQAVAVVRIDNQSGRLSLQGLSADNAINSELTIATDQAVIQSPEVIERVIDKLDLASNPYFAGKAQANKTSSAGAKSTVNRNAVVKNVLDGLTVIRPAGTLLLDIEYRSPSPRLSADVANAIAESFIQYEYDSRSHAITESSKSLSEQLDQLRAKMEQSQQALVEYETANNVVDPSDRTNIMVARLSQLNEALSKAEADRIQLEAERSVADSSNLDSLAITSVGQSLLPLQQVLRQDQQQLAQLAQVYGPRHPFYIQQAEKIKTDEQLLNKEANHIKSQISAEYHSAELREQLVQQALTRQKAELDHYNLRAIRYGLLKAEADSDAKLYYDLLQKMKDSDVAAGFHGEDLRIVTHATPDPKVVSPRPVFDEMMMFMLALAFGVGCAFIAGMLDRTISGVEQIESGMGARVLGILPLAPSNGNANLEIMEFAKQATATGTDPASSQMLDLRNRSQFHEAIMSLHSALSFSIGGSSDMVLSLTSSVPAEGKSTTVAHLGVAYASLRKRTLIIDADMRKPRIHRIFHVANRIGLSTVLTRQANLASALKPIPGIPFLSILPAGPVTGAPAELLRLNLGEIVEQLRADFDVILIDCPPLLGFADALAVSNVADATVLVVYAGKTMKQYVMQSLRQLRGNGLNCLGVILNGVSSKLDSSYSYYNSYYRNYYRESEGGDDE